MRKVDSQDQCRFKPSIWRLNMRSTDESILISIDGGLRRWPCLSAYPGYAEANRIFYALF